MNRCKRCNNELDCLAGESAHPNNWYCPLCDANNRIKELRAGAGLSTKIFVKHIKKLEIKVVKLERQLRFARVTMSFESFAECRRNDARLMNEKSQRDFKAKHENA